MGGASLSETLTAAAAAPLAFGVASPEQAHADADTIRKRLLGRGGLNTTLAETGQQWDRPNGWAPLQYLAIEGLKAYGEPDLAREIARRWIATNVGSYAALGVLAEKYDVARSPDAGAEVGRGGEYALQVGFGWTNGVLAALMAEYPIWLRRRCGRTLDGASSRRGSARETSSRFNVWEMHLFQRAPVAISIWSDRRTLAEASAGPDSASISISGRHERYPGTWVMDRGICGDGACAS